jgi:hypothetical protein
VFVVQGEDFGLLLVPGLGRVARPEGMLLARKPVPDDDRLPDRSDLLDERHVADRAPLLDQLLVRQADEAEPVPPFRVVLAAVPFE